MIYEIFINYMTEILSLRLEITVEIEFPVPLGLLVKSVNSESRQIQVKKSVVRRLHAIFRSKLAGSPEGGVTYGLFGVRVMTVYLTILTLTPVWPKDYGNPSFRVSVIPVLSLPPSKLSLPKTLPSTRVSASLNP
uniref:Uncharacterized protein n=1 Tax=Cucumis melo TaxID=3656 RepID=A0A9I9EIK8_CUCME